MDAIPVGEGRAFAVGAAQVAVFRLRDGSPRATQALCPHAAGPLADGRVDTAKVVCPLHARGYSFAAGRCAEGDQIRRHPVREVDGEIFVEL